VAFNGGFRLKDSAGGFYSEGQTARPLVDGVASLVIRTDGTVDVGVWRRDDQIGNTIVAVRQNLAATAAVTERDSSPSRLRRSQ
jgi:hypothetical protein